MNEPSNEAKALESGWRRCEGCTHQRYPCEKWISPDGDEHQYLPEIQWKLQFSCCGFDQGISIRKTWKEADDLRQSYISALGHDRTAILSLAEGE